MKKWFVLAGLAVAGCSSISSLPDRLSRENAEEVSELARSAQCNSASEAAAITRLPDLAAVLAWQQQRGVTLVSGELPQGPFALVEMGQRATGGYGLAISRLAGRRGGTLILRATFIAPPADAMVSQALTSPCVLVGLPPEAGTTLELLDQDGNVRARSGEAR